MNGTVMKEKLKPVPVLILLSLLLVIGSLQIWLRNDDEKSKLKSIDTKCFITKNACVVTLGNKEATVHVEGNIQPLKPFRLLFETIDTEVLSVEISLQMLAMDMGRNQYQLFRDGEVWYGDIVIPVCTTGRRDWMMDLIITNADGERFSYTVWMQL